jgi:MFS family permease
MVAQSDGVQPEVARSHSDWRAHSIYTLGFLTLISALNYTDRSILSLALPAIKTEMHLSDTLLGLVYGSAFAVFYAIFGIPVAWLADHGNRRRIIAIGFAFWSLMTAVTGAVANLWQLAVSRFLMGCGEACCVPPAHSILSDLFGKRSRALAISIFGTAFSVSFAVFFPLAGWIGNTYGWRAMFVAAGLPGLVLALLFVATVREPSRLMPVPEGRGQERESVSNSMRFFATSPTYLAILAGSALMGANVYATSAWFPTFLARVQGMSLLQVASYVGPLRGILGAVGILGGGWLADRLGRRDARWGLRVPALGCLLLAPAEALFLLADRRAACLAGLALTSFFALLHQGPVFAAAMSIVKPRMRAVASASIVFCAAVIGQIAGPVLIGALNDRLTAALGAQAIRYSLLVATICAASAGLSFLFAAQRLKPPEASRLVLPHQA